jgi:hypothetical protein
LEKRQRLQRLFFPGGVAFSGKSFDRTVVTSSLFEYLRPLDVPLEKFGGPDRDRTGDLLNAIQARSQLRYRPIREKTNLYCN